MKRLIDIAGSIQAISGTNALRKPRIYIIEKNVPFFIKPLTATYFKFYKKDSIMGKIAENKQAY
jgi:hypothetical protein